VSAWPSGPTAQTFSAWCCGVAILLGIGLAVGTALSLAAGTAAASMLFGLKPSDPQTLAMAIVGIAVIALLASLLPAQRAATVQPMAALREE
jgi:ABC-type antimicrobial peptide transport system permease subunit